MTLTRTERRKISRADARTHPIPPKPASYGAVGRIVHQPLAMPTRPGTKTGRRNDKRNQRALFWQGFADAQQPVVVWDGDPWRWSTPYQTAVTDWLAANGIAAKDVPAESRITVRGRWITYTAYVRTEGRIRIGAGDLPVAETHVAPLLVPFEYAEAAA